MEGLHGSGFIAKMHRVLAFYDAPPTDGRVICVDGFSPINLQPRRGKAWRPVSKRRRLRATYNRYGGVMHMLAALDLVTGKIYYRIRQRKTLAGVPRLAQGGYATSRSTLIASITTAVAPWMP